MKLTRPRKQPVAPGKPTYPAMLHRGIRSINKEPKGRPVIVLGPVQQMGPVWGYRVLDEGKEVRVCEDQITLDQLPEEWTKRKTGG